MNQEKYTLFKAVKVLFERLFSNHIHFSKKYVGRTLLMEDGKKFQVIRNLKVGQKQTDENSKAVFKVRFKFTNLPLAVNKRLSIIPALFLMAKPEFLQKIWSVTEDGYFQGLYQWTTKEFAETYPNSFIFKLMTKRSAKGTLSYEVIPNTHLNVYVEKLLN